MRYAIQNTETKLLLHGVVRDNELDKRVIKWGPQAHAQTFKSSDDAWETYHTSYERFSQGEDIRTVPV